jgi:hypothetical protein
MTEKPKKLDEPNAIEKHFSSKLFQKFLQKEGGKLSEAALIPPQVKPEKFQKPPSRDQSGDFSDYREMSPVPYQDNPKSLNKTSPKWSSPDYQNDYPNEDYFRPPSVQQEAPKELIPRQKVKKQVYEPVGQRSRWPDFEPEDPVSKRFCEPFPTKSTELEGYSDYIPPGESFMIFDAPSEVVEKKPPPAVPVYYPAMDPLLAITANNQQIKDLEARLQDKDEEIRSLKSDLEYARQDILELEDKLANGAEIERRMKNLRVERDMIDRKAKSLEEDNEEMRRQMDIARDSLENARFKAEDVERNLRGRIQDLERDARNYKDRIEDLERELNRERERNAGRNRAKPRGYEDDYRREDDYRSDYRRNDDYKRDDYYRRDDDYETEDYYQEKNRHETEPKRGKKQQQDFYTDRWAENYEKPVQERGLSDRPRNERGKNTNQAHNERFQPDPYDAKPSQISKQVKERIGATNSSSVSGILNWESKPRKNEEVLSIENEILSLQTDKKRLEEELAKIPEHAKKIAIIRRREEIENELAAIHSSIAGLKVRAKQLQS